MNIQGRFSHTRKANEESGQALLEFAITLPILLLIVLGIIGYGFYINANVTLQQAARIGARTASLGDTVGCPGDSAEKQLQSGSTPTVYGVVDDQINQGAGLSTGSGSSAQHVLSPIPTILLDPNSPTAANSMVTVTVTMPYHPIVPIPGLLSSTVTLIQTYSMMMENPEPSGATTPTSQQNTVQLTQPGSCP